MISPSYWETFIGKNNTFGFFPVTTDTFNVDRRLTYPKEGRDSWVTALAIHNLILNILGSDVLGYKPGISLYTGRFRILSGLSLLSLTLTCGQPSADNGVLIGRFYKEGVVTGVSQMARGILEAFVPGGLLATAFLDVASSTADLLYNPGKYIVDRPLNYVTPPWQDGDPYPNPGLAELCMFANFLLVTYRTAVLFIYLSLNIPPRPSPPLIYRFPQAPLRSP